MCPDCLGYIFFSFLNYSPVRLKNTKNSVVSLTLNKEKCKLIAIFLEKNLLF